MRRGDATGSPAAVSLSALLAADIEAPVEPRLLAQILVVPHHRQQDLVDRAVPRLYRAACRGISGRLL